MGTKLIRLNDGTWVEATVSEDEARPVSGRFVDQVGAGWDRVSPILIQVANSVKSTWFELNKEMVITEAEIELGLSFEGEGNIYITKFKANSNLNVKLILKPPSSVPGSTTS